jgi:hypothetical protein
LPPPGANSKSLLPTAECKKGRSHMFLKTLVRARNPSSSRFNPPTPTPTTTSTTTTMTATSMESLSVLV